VRILSIALALACTSCSLVSGRYDIWSHQKDDSHFAVRMDSVRTVDLTGDTYELARRELLETGGRLCAPRAAVVGDEIMVTETFLASGGPHERGSLRIEGDVECR
jgi:hypothetical protein